MISQKAATLNLFMLERIEKKKQQNNIDQTMQAVAPTSWICNWSKLPLQIRPTSRSKIPTARHPQNPVKPWIWDASIGSSILNLCSSFVDNMQTEHPITPMIAAAHISTLLQGAVIATRPARIAFMIFPGSCGENPLPVDILMCSNRTNVRAEVAGAMKVVKAMSCGMNVLSISTISYPEEALKKIQPTHSRRPPTIESGVSLAS